MTGDELYKELHFVDHTREKRLAFSNLVLKNQKLIPKLLDIVFMVDDKISIKAAWVLEYLCSYDINVIVPYLDQFTENLRTIHQDAAVRPMAKICERIAISYCSKEKELMQSALSPSHIERIVETCFDYLIEDEKVAPKAFSMNTLFLFGKTNDWVHPELISIIERDYPTQSAGFKARARHVLKQLKQ